MKYYKRNLLIIGFVFVFIQLLLTHIIEIGLNKKIIELNERISVIEGKL